MKEKAVSGPAIARETSIFGHFGGFRPPLSLKLRGRQFANNAPEADVEAHVLSVCSYFMSIATQLGLACGHAHAMHFFAT